jgi:hypothetical protein
MANEHIKFIKDNSTGLTVSEKNQNLAIYLQAAGIKLDIMKIERKEESPSIGWEITYRIPG